LPALAQRWAPERILSFVETAKTHRMGALDFAMPTALSVLSHGLTAFMLFAGLQAVGYSAGISTVLIGYVVGKLFFMMAPVFQGIGIVELGMAIALQQAGVPVAIAVSGALLFRVGDLWLPLLWGFLLQLVRMPVAEHVRQARTQAGEMFSGAARALQRPAEIVSDQAIRFGRIASVTEAPLALMYGAILIMAGGLPFAS
jgi:hypothetical protein